MSRVSNLASYGSCFLLILGSLALSGCIKNDLPYPRIPQNILELEAEGQTKEAFIDSLAFEATVYFDEQADLTNVRFTKYVISPDATSDPDLLDGEYDLSSPLTVTLSLYQDYVWEIKASQVIERYFTVAGQVGETVIDPVAHRVIVTMPDGTDLSRLTLTSVKLGPADITTMTPDLKPGPLDLSVPLSVEVTAHNESEIWTIYAEVTETVVSTSRVDPWSKVIWAYGEGPSEIKNGFEYRRTSDTEWTPVPEQYVTQNGGSFFCYIPHLEPLTEYAVRTVAGEDVGNEVIVTTEATADIPDGDFEQWYQTEKGMWNPWNKDGERYWDTGNTGSMTMKVNLTTPTDHTVTGSGIAARCESKFVSLFGIGKLGSGSIFTGEYLRTDVTDGVLGFGRPWKLRPTKLKGYMQYQGVPISHTSADFVDFKDRPDSCQIYVALTDWTAPYEIRTKPSNRQLFNPDADYVIAYGQLTFSGVQDNYVPFEIELKYKSTAKIPSYLQITCTASKYGDYFTGGAGSVLYIDQFYFDWDY
ncbi:MAG: PCMD domain-containing protein [Muribaculaceae bacterium]|nr:PCMD domain-containing protein [Muribaculaceae bacterium]